MSSDPPLDPGVPARKRGSFCKFCMCISLVLFGLLLATFVYALGKALFGFTQVSHSRMYQNQTLEEVTDRATIVRPLVDENQRFDFAVSIWAPTVDENGSHRSRGVAETPLYSDIVFRGLRLADKHKSANLTYRLPVTIFKRLALKHNDLRASFVLIPTSPSLMDQVTDFSTWRSEYLAIPPVRSWPFPLGAADSRPQSVADRALDSFGISMPLLEFHEVGSRCANSTNPETSSVENEITQERSDDDDDDDEDGEGKEIQRKAVAKVHTATAPLGVSDITQFPEHALKRHPFVVTRTQIRVVDETQIFNRKLYNREHYKLRSTSCGQERYGYSVLNLCDRTYTKNGNWETRLELKVPDEVTGEPLTEWAYAPYIGYAASSAGPKDISAVPVMRENCTQFENTSSTDPGAVDLQIPTMFGAYSSADFITINWQLSYSGRSPLKYLGADLIVRPKRLPYNETDYKTIFTASIWYGAALNAVQCCRTRCRQASTSQLFICRTFVQQKSVVRFPSRQGAGLNPSIFQITRPQFILPFLMPCKMFDCSDYDNKSTSASKRLLAIILRCTISSGYNLITAWRQSSGGVRNSIIFGTISNQFDVTALIRFIKASIP
ncbi:hypothetical protein C8J57DRAFT_1524589 [Mycena rebaudengoi]|nr:hypothetical protein C8J57DRAFT_1524589 [Mycena rebaudengoi]